MQYLISFFEGIITFISPCLLPMLPIYVTYFAGGRGENANGKRAVINSLGFSLGFTLVFMALGVFAGLIGGFLREYAVVVNIITGGVVILFGLHFLGVFQLKFLKGGAKKVNSRELGFFSAALFGIVFSISWTPCVGAFLGSALMLASQRGSALAGMLMLLCYSLGLAIPFVASAVLIDKLKSAFNFIKSHYGIINKVCGVLLIIIGLLMATGLMQKLLGAVA